MNIQQEVINTLEKLATGDSEQVDAVVQTSPEKRYIVGIPPEGDGVGASINLVDYDRYSVTLQHLEVFNTGLKIAPGNEEAWLHQVAGALSHQLSFLEEPLALIELDTVENVALLRSSPPKNGGSESTYWELRVSLAHHPITRLTRYHWSATTANRTPVAHPITFATLGRIAENEAAALKV